MARLVNAMREGIVNRLIAHTFDAEKRELCNTAARLALIIYEDVFDAATRKRMQSLPEGWLPTDDDLQVEAGGTTRCIRFNGTTYRYAGRIDTVLAIDADDIEKRFPANKQHGSLKVYNAHHAITEALEALWRARSDLYDRILLATKQARATLDAVHTVEKLVEQWPEIAPFIDEKDKPVPVTALALPTQQLNEMFKLPVGDAA